MLQLWFSSAVKFTSKQSMSRAAKAGGCIRKAQNRTWRTREVDSVDETGAKVDPSAVQIGIFSNELGGFAAVGISHLTGFLKMLGSLGSKKCLDHAGIFPMEPLNSLMTYPLATC